MTSHSGDFDFFPILLLFITTIYILFVSESDIFTIILIIITACGVAISFRKYKTHKREVEQPVIMKLINNFIKPVINQLYSYKTPQTFFFPDSLNQWMGLWLIDNKNFSNEWYHLPIVDDEIFRSFSGKKRTMAWKIKRFTKFCNSINEKIRNMATKAKEQNIIESIADVNGIRWVLQEQYEDLNKDDLDKILRTYNLLIDITEINNLSKEISKKSNKLLKKLEKLKEKWKKLYNLP